jgi:p-aminobenzoyl-glutamate transporter AbgT
MSSIVTSVFAVILFIILSPNVLLRLPPNGSKMTVVVVHALIFGTIFYFIHPMVYGYFNKTHTQCNCSKTVKEGVSGRVLVGSNQG